MDFGGLKMDYVIIILGALTTGFWLGVWATYVNFTKPLHEVEEGLRKELGEVRRTLVWREYALAIWEGSLGINQDFPVSKIEHREPSDVFFQELEDLLQ